MMVLSIRGLTIFRQSTAIAIYRSGLLPMKTLNHHAVPTAIAVEWRRLSRARTAIVQGCISNIWAKVVWHLRIWRDRQLDRRELSMMSARDFGDLPVPASVIADETRRWPWQTPSPQWSEVYADRRSAGNGGRPR
jgi:hypothetical protein